MKKSRLRFGTKCPVCQRNRVIYPDIYCSNDCEQEDGFNERFKVKRVKRK